MGQNEMPAMQMPMPAIQPVRLKADPEPLDIDLQRMALMVIDMQNAFVSKGGMFDLWGMDVSKDQEIIGSIARIRKAARTKGCKIIYTMSVHSLDLRDTGGPGSPGWYRNKNLVTFREHPELRDKLTVRGTWGAQIIKELKPDEDDIVIQKHKFSAFFGTDLDIILKTYNIKYLAFTGVATNICVEATIRDACYREYFPILVSDACANAGPYVTQEAAIFNVKFGHGWVTTTESLVAVLL